MHRLFDEPWETLSLESVRRFLADAGDEGLLWEAKGPEPNGGPVRANSIYKALSGFANSSGGYLLLGVGRRKEGGKEVGSWLLPGLVFPGEPKTWARSIINAEVGLAPIPVNDVAAFPVPIENDADDSAVTDPASSDAEAPPRYVVVVRVEPVPVPPCVTKNGSVFVRVSGQTKPVTDPRVLMDLVHKGENARTIAADAALRAAKRVLAESAVLPAEMNVLAVGFCAVSGPADKAAVLFDEGLSQFFFDVVGRDMRADRSFGEARSSSMRQDALYVVAGADAQDRATTAAAFWDGGVAAALHYSGRQHDLPALEAVIHRYWRGLARIAKHYGGIGEAHLAVVFNFRHPSLSMNPDEMPVTDIRRWTNVGDPSQVEQRSVALELRRGFSEFVWAD